MKKTLMPLVKVSTFLGIVCVLAFQVHAINTSDPNNSTKERSKIQNTNKYQVRCKKAEEMIEKQILSYEKNKEQRYTIYENVREKAKKIVEKAKTRGLNTSELEKDLVTLDSKIEDAKQAYESYISALKSTKAFACGQSDGNFVNSLKDTRNKFQVATQKIKEARQFVQSDIKQDITLLHQEWIRVQEQTKQGDQI